MKSVAIIGGGVAGMEAAYQLQKQGLAVTIIERENQLGGRLNQWHALFPALISSDILLKRLQQQVSEGINILTGVNITAVERNDDGFAIRLGDNRMVTAASVLVTAGFEIFEAEKKEEYGYGIYDNIITSVDLESTFRSGKTLTTAAGKTPSRIGFIHCVGSRDEKAGNLHCSKVCCVTAVKQAIELRKILPNCEIILFYMDLRMFGRHYEELYREAQVKHKIQFIRARLSEAFENPDGSLQIRVEDTLLAKPLKMSLDMLVLMVGIQSHKIKGNIIDMLQLERNSDGFPKVTDQFTAPFSANIPGLFLAGGITGPKTMEETLNEARGVSLEISSYFKRMVNARDKEKFVLEL